VSLKEGHKPTAIMCDIAQVLPQAFPEDTFYFQAADIVTQILNFGCRRRSTCAPSAMTRQ